ncbi:MAG: hypothetical protein AAGF28_01115 [Pseudomonadota bacterium]
MTPQLTHRLTEKLSRIKAGQYKPTDFIIADAKDAEMGGGINGVGFTVDDAGHQKAKTALDYRNAMAKMMASGLVDIMLTSMASADAMHSQNAFDGSNVTAAVRLNDATDIWGFRGARYRENPAIPFRTANLESARAVCALGLYAIAFYNDGPQDVATLNAYRTFREEAAQADMAHFLEVFNPAFDIDTGGEDLGLFINDAIVRCLAGVPKAQQPLFLKMQYNGARPMEELAAYDPANLIVGVLGGAAGTTRDTFELVAQVERFGGRVALFGRKIYGAEDAVELVRLMRAIIEDGIGTVEAVKLYHDGLSKKGIVPTRTPDEDVQVTDPVLSAEAQ